MAPLRPDELHAAIAGLGLEGQAVCVHSSMRSFDRRIEAGDLLDGFLAAGATVMTPTFTYELSQPPPADDRPERNGLRYDEGDTIGATDASFSVSDNALSLAEMGQFPRVLLNRAERIRGRHPLNSFAALGPVARELVADQSPDDVYAPLDALTAVGGSLVLIGVDYRSVTLLHMAEMRAGRTLFRRWARLDGQAVRANVGGCSAGFRNFEPVLDPIARRRSVSGSEWRVLPARDALMTAIGAIRRNPSVTRCDDPHCLRCPDAIAGGPVPQ